LSSCHTGSRLRGLRERPVPVLSGLGDLELSGTLHGLGVVPGPVDVLRRAGLHLVNLSLRLLADLLDLGCGWLARGFSGLPPLLRFERLVACLLGGGIGLLPEPHLPVGLGFGIGDLLACFRLHRLYLRLGALGVGGPVQLRSELSKFCCQRGHVGPGAPAQVSGPCGGHGDRAAQIFGLGSAALPG
jgi:hypothetical protein